MQLANLRTRQPHDQLCTSLTLKGNHMTVDSGCYLNDGKRSLLEQLVTRAFSVSHLVDSSRDRSHEVVQKISSIFDYEFSELGSFH